MIPKILHYCFGMTPDFGRKPWSLVHYVCLKSAVEWIKPSAVLFHCEFEPAGPWWEITRALVTMNKMTAPREIFGNPILHPAHRADVVRLEKLIEVGGIYLDCDVFVRKPFDSLLCCSTVLGEERVGEKINGLCNAVVLAEPSAPFMRKWHSEYKSFRSRGGDDYWNEHSVIVPYRLSKAFPSEVTVLPSTSFFWPTWQAEDIARIFDSATPIDLSAAYASHLWENLAWDEYLEHLTPRRVREVDTNFHRWIRPMLADLPNDYGMPTVTARLARRIRHLKRRAGSARARLRRVQRPV